jgi:hypothetical protein
MQVKNSKFYSKFSHHKMLMVDSGVDHALLYLVAGVIISSEACFDLREAANREIPRSKLRGASFL